MIELFYNGYSYIFEENKLDPSVKGCIKEIITNNEYNLEKFVNMNTSIIDIGANCGICSIILAKQNPQSKIYSFEPDINVYSMLLNNIKLNNINNIIPYNQAVSDVSNKILQLNLHPYYSGGNTTCSNNNNIDNFFNFKTKSINILSKSLDDIINENNIDTIGLLKIDCEGAEYEILYNSIKFKTNIVKNLIGEFHNIEYNINSLNKPYELFDYCKKYINGFKKVVILELGKNNVKQDILCDDY